ncbi:MAG: YHYH protein [Isosphaeraceae bacterium]
MRKRLPFPWFLLLLAGLPASTRAHDGHEREDPRAPTLAGFQRSWTHASGRFEVHGTFVATHGDQVQIRTTEGKLVDLRRAALSNVDRAWVDDRIERIRGLNESGFLLAQRGAERKAAPNKGPAPAMLASFKPFASKLELRWDEDYAYVGSNGVPDHPMMIGITAWQQQVPLPQSYFGSNAWRIPLHPVPARQPLSARDHFFRGAIALAVNGIPIFNPIKNDGRTDTFIAGELDDYGGHCGRADDYHYHIAPVHLAPKLAKGQPLAYALDGYPIYGYEEPDGSKAVRLDVFNGHEDAQKQYHYHATKAYPYLNGGFHGEVVEREGQVDPQPHADPVRPALPPLRGAKITGFENPKPGNFTVTYDIRGRKSFVKYTIQDKGSVAFQFVDSTGRTTNQTYSRRERGRGGPPPRRADDEPPPRDDDRRPPPRDGERRPPPPLIAALDGNKDGTLSPVELASAATAIRKLDRDGDGTVTNEELRPARPPGDENPPPPPRGGRARGGNDRPPPPGNDRRRPPPPEMAAIDLNHDGALSPREIDAAPKSLLTLDRDQDGTLSDEELRPENPPDEPPPPGGDRPQRKNQQPPRRRDQPPPRDDEREAANIVPPGDFGKLVVSSPAFKHGGRLPAEYTCDGAGASPPVAWENPPEGTQYYALSLWHTPPDGGTKSYWVVYNIPATVTSVPRNVKGVGQEGYNDKRHTGYDPMCSKGPGLKTYHVTVYALSRKLSMRSAQPTRTDLLEAMKGLVLAQSTLTYQYERPDRE